MPTSSKSLFIALSIVFAIVLPLLSFDAGITEDEQLHNQHGKSILDYFQGRSDLATRSPLDGSGKVTFHYGPEMQDRSGALNIYGGVFDLVCAFTQSYLSPLGEFENRHFVNSLFGVLLIVFTGLTAAQVAGWRAGVVALLLIGLSPRIVGHSMNNPVDLPFAALYVFSIYFMLRFLEELPRPSPRTWAPLMLGIPLAADVRIAGLVLICYLGFFAGIWCLARVLASGSDPVERRDVVRAMLISAGIGAGSYLLVSVAWPLAHDNPLTTPLMALRHLSQLETFNAYDLFEGQWINRWEIPWYFVPKWLILGTPLFVPLGLLLSPALAAESAAKPKADRLAYLGRLGVLAFTFLFPIVFIIVRQSNVYNDARHALFTYPPLVAFCAIVFASMLPPGRFRIPRAMAAVLLAATLLEPLAFMLRNHPHSNVYFTPLVGGVRGAWMRYETDFWGNSVREAVEWIQSNVEPQDGRPIRIRSWYGDQTKIRYYVEKRPGYRFVVAMQDSTEWDYEILQTVACKHFPDVLTYWPPPGTVYEVKVDGTPLTAVLVNHRNREPDRVLGAMRRWVEKSPSHAAYLSLATMLEQQGMQEEALDAFREAAKLRPDPAGWAYAGYLERSLALFRAGHYEESIMACRLALQSQPDSAIAYNNICAAHNVLENWDDARHACEKALELQPDFPRARSNLAVATDGSSRP